MSSYELPFWGWWIAGCVLLVAEITTATFMFLFFSIAAFGVGAVKLVGLDNLTAELILFGLLGLLTTAVFRKSLIARFRPAANRWDAGADVKSIVALTQALAARGESTTEYQGSSWTVVNDSDVSFAAGHKVEVKRVEGVKLIVGPIAGQ
jgi:membrane protein implicated in regulation of membrane protease activity